MEYPIILHRKNIPTCDILLIDKNTYNNTINKSTIEKSYDFDLGHESSSCIFNKKKLNPNNFRNYKMTKKFINLSNNSINFFSLTDRIEPSYSKTQKNSKEKKNINETSKSYYNVKKIILLQKKIRNFLLKKKQIIRRLTFQKNYSQTILYKKKLPKINNNKINSTKINWVTKPKIRDKIKKNSIDFFFNKIFIKNTKNDIKKIKRIQKYWRMNKQSNIFTYIHPRNSAFFDFDSYQSVTSINSRNKKQLKSNKLNITEIDDFNSDVNDKSSNNDAAKIPQSIQLLSNHKHYNSIILQYEDENKLEKSFIKSNGIGNGNYSFIHEKKWPINFKNMSLKRINPKIKELINMKSSSINIGKRIENKEVSNNNLNIFHKNKINPSFINDRDNMDKYKNLKPNKFFIKINSDKIEKKLVINTNDIANKPDLTKLKNKNKNKNKNKKTTVNNNFYFDKEDNSIFYWEAKISKKQILINKYFINDIQNSEKDLELERRNTSQKPKNNEIKKENK